MLKDNKAPKKRLSLPNIPKPIKIILGIFVGLFLIIVILSFFSGRKSGANQPIINVLSREQEIVRVSTYAQQQLHFQDQATQALAATVSSALSSEKSQLSAYLAKNGTKVNVKLLAGDLDKTSDTALQTAAQNNGLDAAYVAYLKDNLAKYESELQTAFKVAGANGKTLLSEAFNSTKTLLAIPPLGS